MELIDEKLFIKKKPPQIVEVNIVSSIMDYRTPFPTYLPSL